MRRIIEHLGLLDQRTRNPYTSVNMTDLPMTLSAFISAPDLHVGTDEISARRIVHLDQATISKPNAVELASSWNYLHISLQESPLLEQFTTSWVAGLLLHQTSLPLSERALSIYAQTKNDSLHKELIAEFHENQFSSEESAEERTSLARALALFQTEIETKLDDPETDMKEKITIQDAFLKSNGIFTQHWADMVSPEITEWTERIMERRDKVLQHPEAVQVLLAGDLQTVEDDIRWDIWKNALVRQSEQGETSPAMTNFFFQNPDIAGRYMEEVSSSTKMLPRSVHEKEEDKRVKKVNMVYAVAESFFLQDEATLQQFLRETLPAARLASAVFEDEQVRKDIYKKFAGFIAFFNNRYPGHENTDAVTQAIKERLPTDMEDELANYFAVLDGEREGVIVMNKVGNVSAKVPTPGQTIDRVVSNQIGQNEVLHISKNPENESLATEPEVEPLPRGEEQEHPVWGRVDVVRSSDIGAVLEALAERRLNVGPIDRDKLERRTNELQRPPVIKSGKRPNVLTTFLPEPFRALKEMGIVSIGQEGDQVSVVINPHPKKADIVTEPDSPELLVLQGTFDQQEGVVFPDITPDRTVSLLLKAASLLGRKPPAFDLTRDDEREINGHKGALKTARTSGEVPFDKDCPAEETVLIVIGDKLVHIPMREEKKAKRR